MRTYKGLWIGIIGTFHHLYFTGTPNSVLALGATFSALEIVPLVLIGFEAWENITGHSYRRGKAVPVKTSVGFKKPAMSAGD